MITQGTFTNLPDLTDEEISAQVAYALGQGWAISIEHSDDPIHAISSGSSGDCPCSTWRTPPPSSLRCEPAARRSLMTTSG